MSEDTQPAKVGSSEGLGPLPSPDMQADPCSADGAQTDYYTAGTVRRLLAAERERCAKPMEDAAARLLAPKRTNEVDRHVAEILQTHAARIRGA